MSIWHTSRTPRFRQALLLFLTLAGVNAWAGPPYFTDDPEPVDYRHWESYLASQYVRVNGVASGTLPQMEFNYGAYPNLQLHIMGTAAFNRPDGGPSAYGGGDTEVGAKYRFIQETEGHPQVSTFVTLEIPTGSVTRGLGNGRMQLLLPIWMQKSWGRWTTYGGGGYWINGNPDVGNSGFVGWLLQRDLSKTLTLGAEIFRRQGDTPEGPTGTAFTAGGQINFNDHLHFLLAAGRDFTSPANPTHYVGFQWTY